MSRFAKALGVWEIKFCDPTLELKPTMKDVRGFRNLLLNENHRKDKVKLFDAFADFMFGLIKSQYPAEVDQDLRDWVELHLNPLFEETMVTFKWTTKAELEKSKEEAMRDLKKLMSSA